MNNENENNTPQAIQASEDQASEEHSIRLQKVEKLKAAGIKAWPEFKPVNADCKQVLDEFKDDEDSREYQVAGRIVSLRLHGKTAFAHIQDRTGRLQVYIRKDAIGEEQFQVFKDLIDNGDIIWVSGHSFKTKMGEITIKVTELSLLSKCLHPLPEKFHGLADIEVIYRQRYLDLISNSESLERFKNRSKIIRAMRQFFDEYDFMEVETPMLHPIPGGAAARPFVTHHNALDNDLYLRIAPELFLKRLVVGGLERVYEIGRTFRNEGISTRHNPEFTMVEWYMAHHDYHYMMDFVEKMIRKAALACGDTLQLQYGEYTLDFEKPFDKLSMKEAVIKYADCTEDQLKEGNIDKLISQHNIKLVNKNASWGEKLYALFEELVESKLINPTFVYQFPVEVSPLAKRDPEHPGMVARFELFIAGMEISNGFNELNDPFDQADRFRQQAEARSAGDAEAHHYDADYVLALQHALPPTVGVGIGVDRLTMLLTNTTSIKDVILFPTLKKK